MTQILFSAFASSALRCEVTNSIFLCSPYTSNPALSSRLQNDRMCLSVICEQKFHRNKELNENVILLLDPDTEGRPFQKCNTHVTFVEQTC